MSSRMKSLLRNVLVVVLSTVGIFVAFRLSTAGSLTPSAPPSGTMNSLQEMYDALIGSFDSTAIVASSQGSAMEISKCIIAHINGDPCP